MALCLAGREIYTKCYQYINLPFDTKLSTRHVEWPSTIWRNPWQQNRSRPVYCSESDPRPRHSFPKCSCMESHLGFYSAFPDIGNYFPISRIGIPDIGKSISNIRKWSISRYREMIFGYREMCLISRYREINSRYPKIATRQKQVTAPSCHPQPYRPHLLVDTVIMTSGNRSVQPTIIIQPMISHKNTEICGAELMSLMILTRTEHWDN